MLGIHDEPARCTSRTHADQLDGKAGQELVSDRARPFLIVVEGQALNDDEVESVAGLTSIEMDERAMERRRGAGERFSPLSEQERRHAEENVRSKDANVGHDGEKHVLLLVEATRLWRIRGRGEGRTGQISDGQGPSGKTTTHVEGPLLSKRPKNPRGHHQFEELAQGKGEKLDLVDREGESRLAKTEELVDERLQEREKRQREGRSRWEELEMGRKGRLERANDIVRGTHSEPTPEDTHDPDASGESRSGHVVLAGGHGSDLRVGRRKAAEGGLCGKACDSQHALA